MADSYTVVVANGPAFAGAMDDIKASLAKPAGPLADAARATLDAARPNTPFETGRLAGAGRVQTSGAGGRARLVVDTDYAAVIHWGWPEHHIRRQPWLTATFRRDPKPLDALARGVQADLDRAAAKT